MISFKCFEINEIPDTVNDGREKAIKRLIVLLHETRDAFIDGPRGCSFECRSIMYGALTTNMQSNNLLLPKPEAPFPGLNYNYLVQKVLEFTSPEWHRFGSYSRHSCNDSTFASVFAIPKDSFEGLELNRFTGS